MPEAVRRVVARIGENCEPSLCSVLYVAGAGGSLRAGVTENPVALTRSIKSLLVDQIVKPDIVPPGNKIVSNQGKGGHILAQIYPDNKVVGTYFRLSGTNLSTPLVSGAAALLLQKTPTLTPNQVKARLTRTATKVFR